MPDMSFMFTGLGGRAPVDYSRATIAANEEGLKLSQLMKQQEDQTSIQRAIVTTQDGKIDRQTTLRNLANKPHLQAQLGQEFAKEDAENERMQSQIGLQQAQAQKAAQDTLSKMNDDQREQMIMQARDIAAASGWIRQQPDKATAWDMAVERFGAPQEKGKYSPERLDMYEMTAKALMSTKPESFKAQSALGKLAMDYQAGLISKEDYDLAVKKATTKSPGVSINMSQPFEVADPTTGKPILAQQDKATGKIIPVREFAPKETVTGETGQAAMYAKRARAAQEAINEVGEAARPSPAERMLGALPASIGNPLIGDKAQKYQTAKRAFIAAVLRKESGAAISKSEFDQYEAFYFPQLGDSQEVIAQKAAMRNDAVQSLETLGGPALKREKGRVSEETQKNQPKKGASTADELLKQLFGGK